MMLLYSIYLEDAMDIQMNVICIDIKYSFIYN